MIISYRHKFIFLHARKTAGTSLMTALTPHLGPNDICLGDIELAVHLNYLKADWKKLLRYASVIDLRLVSKRWRIRNMGSGIAHRSLPIAFKSTLLRRYMRKVSGLTSAHSTSAQIRKAVGEEIWNSFFKFTIARNPWDRFLSFYKWRTRTNENPPSFNEFIRLIESGDPKKIKSVDGTNYCEYEIYSINHSIALDYIGKFEDLNSEAQKIFDYLDLPLPLPLPKEKSDIRQRKPDMDELKYSPEQVERVRNLLIHEIQLLDYREPSKAVIQ